MACVPERPITRHNYTQERVRGEGDPIDQGDGYYYIQKLDCMPQVKNKFHILHGPYLSDTSLPLGGTLEVSLVFDIPPVGHQRELKIQFRNEPPIDLPIMARGNVVVYAQKEVVKIVEVVVTATPTWPTPVPTSTPTTTPVPLLEAFNATASIAVQIGSLVHQLRWGIINNSQQTITIVGAAIRKPHLSDVNLGSLVAQIDSGFIDQQWGGGHISAGGELSAFTDFRIPPTVEEVSEYRWIWKIQTQTEGIIQCTFTTVSKMCIYV